MPGNRANAAALPDLGLERETLEAIFFRNALQVYRLETTLGCERLDTTRAPPASRWSFVVRKPGVDAVGSALVTRRCSDQPPTTND